MASAACSTGVVYERRRPERTTLYEVVRDNVETLYGAIDDGAIAIRIPQHAKKELDAYLDCGLLCRGFARLRCESCDDTKTAQSWYGTSSVIFRLARSVKCSSTPSGG